MGYRNKVKVIRKEDVMKSDRQLISSLDRDGTYRIAALQCAIQRAAQDSGIHGETVDVYSLAEGYYAWLGGKGDTQKPKKEIFKKTKGL